MVWGKHIVIQADNRKYPVMQFGGSVGDALNKAKVTLRGADIVYPPLDTPVVNEQEIIVKRVVQEGIYSDQLIEFKLERKTDRKLIPGQQQVVQYGKCGVSRSHYLATYQDGQEVKREEVGREIIREPQPMIVAMGPAVTVSRSQVRTTLPESMEGQVEKVITAGSTAYTHTGYRTATGVTPYKGVVSVDPRVIPLGTKLFVENYGPAVAMDTGGDIKGNRIDVFFETQQEAISWGRRTVKVHIME
ncbi:3D domain-containing protein [Desulforamulus aquiferis]|uniref:3D domain-containing protein n=2 Tax=Desulforamulus aquiferis TaxID=1397668 RepID=A0AAW7ZFC5_9FIRM|nr:3D domain-containing protein [Desulforamulus aquiferis]